MVLDFRFCFLIIIALFCISETTADCADCTDYGSCIDKEPNGTCIQCACPQGFTGACCQTDAPDACSSNPCNATTDNHFVCTDLSHGLYNCSCAPGYSGDDCSDTVDPCNPNPCMHGGTCHAGGDGTFTCSCPNHYEGEYCNTATNCGNWFVDCGCDPDNSNPCQNGGTCMEECSGNYYCMCPTNFTGDNCENEPCASVTCQHGGYCYITDSGDAACLCLDIWTGDNCETFDACAYTNCQNGGTCQNNDDGTTTCNCVWGYSGDKCQNVTDFCDPNPCAYPLHGKNVPVNCSSHFGGYYCDCPFGTTGQNCSTNIDDCVVNGKNPCTQTDTHGNCTDGLNSYKCYCSPEYTGADCSMSIIVWNVVKLFGGSDALISLLEEVVKQPSLIKNIMPFLLGQMPEANQSAMSWDYDDLFVWASYEKTEVTSADIIKSFDTTLGNCFTFNDQNSSKIYNLRQPGAQGGFRALMRVRQDEYLAWYDTAALLVFIHTSDEIVFSESLRYQISPNTSSTVITREITYSRLGGKYGTCIKDISEVHSYYYSGDYTTDGCLNACYQDAIQDSCECMDPRYAMPSTATPCTIDSWNCVNNVTVVRGDPSNWESCFCPSPCYESQYESDWTSTAFVGSDIYCSSVSGSKDAYCMSNYTDMAYVNVYIPRLSLQVFQESPAMTFNQFIGNIGGLAGMFMGFAIITVIDFGFLIVLLIRVALIVIACICISETTAMCAECTDYGYCMTEASNGSCIKCACPQGFTGACCQIDASAVCGSNPCNATTDNHFVCTDFPHGLYQCTCAPGYGGDDCSDTVNPCDSDPCWNGGTCHTGDDGTFTCECWHDYTGIYCESKDSCYTYGCDSDDPSQCQNGGTCVEECHGDHSCICPTGFTGDSCEDPLCDPTPCEHGGHCTVINSHGDRRCICLNIWTGEHCDTFDACAYTNCLNGGTCQNNDDGTTNCNCVWGYSGDKCQNVTNFCDPNPCAYPLHGRNISVPCSPHLGGFYCDCPSGTTGQNCSTNIDDCVVDEKNPCTQTDPNANCTDGLNSYKCYCGPEYTGANCSMSIIVWNVVKVFGGSDALISLMEEVVTQPSLIKNIMPFLLGQMSAENQSLMSWEYDDLFVWASYEKTELTSADIVKSFDTTLGNCFTFNDQNSSKTYNVRQAGAQGGFRALMKVRQDEYLSWYDTAALLVFIHPSDETVFSESLRYQIAPNTSGTVITKKLTYSRLSGKYGTCVDDISQVQSYYYSGSYTTNGCLNACYQDAIQEICNCMDPRYAMPEGATPCSMDAWNCVNNVTIVKGDPSNWDSCFCPSPCHESQYESDWTTTAFIGSDIYCSSVSGSKDAYCMSNYTDMAYVNVYIPRLSQRMFQETPAMTFNQFIGNMGGIAGMLMGFAIITVIDFGFLAVLLAKAAFFNVIVIACVCISETTALCADCTDYGYCMDKEPNGTCIKCACPQGFTGACCQIDASAVCGSNPCNATTDNHFVCTDFPHGLYQCTCAPGYGGDDCSDTVNPCDSGPCLNGGTCNAGDDGTFTCKCHKSNTGIYCQSKSSCYNYGCDSDDPSQCQNGGTCVEECGGDHSCICPIDFTGDNCETSICSDTTCEHGGYCTVINSNGDRRCTCLNIWTGEHCDTFDACAYTNCLNGGTCQNNDDGTTTCNCILGYSGDKCQNLTNFCDPNPCAYPLHGRNVSVNCTWQFAGYYCDCPVGTTGQNCSTNIDDCCVDGENPCTQTDTNGNCTDGLNSFKCYCSPEYTGADCSMSIIVWNVVKTFGGSDALIALMEEVVTQPSLIKNIMPFLLGQMSAENQSLMSWEYDDLFVWASYEKTELTSVDIVKSFDTTLGNCFTFNDQNSSKMYNLRQPGAQGGFRALMRVRQDEYLSWYDTAALLVFIHTSDQTVFSESLRYQISPNTSGTVVTEKITYSRLNGKYGTCANDISEVHSYYYSGSYTTDGCLNACYQDAVQEICNCMDPRYAMSEGATPCSIDAWNCVNNVTIVKGDPSNWDSCFCPSPCHESQYESDWTTTAFIGSDIYCSSVSGSKDAYCMSNYTDMAYVNVYIPRLSQQMFQETPAMTFNQFIGNIGGIAGMLMGFAIITVIDFGCLAILLAKATCCNGSGAYNFEE